MRGLVLKDFICLKRNLKMFTFVTLGVIAIAVMFILSSRFGNIYHGLKNYDSTDTMDKDMLISMIELSMHLILVIPMAFVGNIIDCFIEDRKADFYKNLLCMPLNNYEIIGARYISLVLYVLVGLLCSGLAAFCMCICSETLVFKEMFSVVLFFGGFFIIDTCFAIPCIYALGAKWGRVASVLPIVVILGVGIFMGDKVMQKYEQLPDEAYMMVLFDKIKNLLTDKGVIVSMVALGMLVCSYFVSVIILKKKRGLGL